MRTFFVRLLQLSPLLIILVATNYFIDPANLFHGDEFESGIADHLLKGLNVTNVTNYDERRLQRYIIEKNDRCPSTIAIGASRIMILDYASDSGFRNNGVSGASLEDYLAIIELYEKKGCQINKIIIDIEPYLLNDAHGQERWISLDHEFNAMMQKISPNTDVDRVTTLKLKTKRYFELFSPSYFKNAVQQMLKGRDRTYLPTRDAFNIRRTIVADGSITYSAEERAVKATTVEEGVQKIIANNTVYSMAGFHELSPRYSDMFEKFIDHLLQCNIKVEFRLFPYHPYLYRYFKENQYYDIVVRAEQYFRAFANKRRITVIGSYDPNVLGYDGSSFYDAYHLKRELLLN